uniref:Uncharacterized protein n=1 Tax=Chelonoidis abingdonii TaxID=106734 RepID=A0A8C0GWU8_CHEAB
MPIIISLYWGSSQPNGTTSCWFHHFYCGSTKTGASLCYSVYRHVLRDSHSPKDRSPAPAKGPPTYKRAQSKPSKFLTLPAETSRAKRRYSLNGELMEYRWYGNSHNTGGLWSKRSMSMNGMLIQSDNSDVDSGKATFSSSEWILESTV